MDPVTNSGSAGDLPPERISSNPFQRLPPVPFVILTLCLIFVLYQLLGGVATFLIMGGTVTEENVVSARLLTMAGQLLLILLPTLLLARLRSSDLREYFGMRIPAAGQVIATVVGVLALQQVFQGYMALQESIPLPDELDRFLAPIRDMIEETYTLLVSAGSPTEFLFVILVVAVVPAIVEEFLFRGLVQKNLEKSGRGLRAAVSAGILFGAYHLNPFTLVPLAGLGIYFGFLSYRSGNILLAIIAHFANNFIACYGVYSELGEDFVALSPANPNAPVMLVANTVVFSVGFALSVWYFLRMTPRQNPELQGPPA